MSLASRVSPGKERGRIQLAGCEQKARGDYASMGTGLRRPTRNLCILMPAGYDAPRSYDAVFAFNDFPGKKRPFSSLSNPARDGQKENH